MEAGVELTTGVVVIVLVVVVSVVLSSPPPPPQPVKVNTAAVQHMTIDLKGAVGGYGFIAMLPSGELTVTVDSGCEPGPKLGK
jgi:hypothetical protein